MKSLEPDKTSQILTNCGYVLLASAVAIAILLPIGIYNLIVDTEFLKFVGEKGFKVGEILIIRRSLDGDFVVAEEGQLVLGLIGFGLLLIGTAAVLNALVRGGISLIRQGREPNDA